MIKGITIKLFDKVEVGVDSFNNPIYQEKTIFVNNVLVAPTSSDDVVSQQNINGAKAVYTLAIPKGDDNIWEDRCVEFFGSRWHVLNIPTEGIEKLIPLCWNKKVMVERYE